MPLFTLNAFSVALADFDAANQLPGFVFQLDSPVQVEIDDANGSLTQGDVGSTTVTVGDDNQGPITGISYRTITSQLGNGATVSVLVLERANVADYLLIPIDRDNGTVIANLQSPGTNFRPGETFDVASLTLGIETSVGHAQAPNQSPVALGDNATTNEDVAVTIDILGNDSDPEDDDLVVTLGNPSNGSVAEVNGAYVYTPDANFNGTDSFIYTLFDGEFTASATVNILISAVNDAPVAGAGTATTNENDAVAVDVSDFATDIDSASLTFGLDTDAANGNVSVGAGGVLTYTPATGFSGGDSFTYSVSDGELVDTGVVSVTVNPVNDAPEAVNDSFETAFGTPVVLTPLANDDDADGDDLTITGLVGTAVGAVQIAGDGKSISYTPAAGYSGTDTFGYVASDGTATDTALIEVTVAEAENAAPVAADDTASTNEDASVYIDILDNDEDPDGDNLTVELGQPENGSVQFDGEGYIYTPDADFNGNDSFNYSIGDGEFEDEATVSITVAPVNDAPEAEDDTFGTAFGTPLTLTPLSNDSDPDGDDLTITGLVGTAAGAVQIAADGKSISYTPANGFSGTDTFGYQASDGTENDTASISVTVADNENDAPVASNDSAETTEDSSVYINILANDEDPDGDSLSIVLGEPVNGSVQFDGEGYLYTPDENFSGNDSFSYTINDGEFQDQALVNIFVSAVNDAPEAGNGEAATAEDMTVTVNVAALASDIDSTDLTFSLAGNAANGNVVNNNDGTFTYTPDADFNGADGFAYTVSDGELEASGEIELSVSPVNDAPVAADDTADTPFETAVTIDVLENDSDVDGDDIGIIAAIANGLPGLISFGVTGVVYTPAAGFSGSGTIDVTISDGLATATSQVAVTVGAADNMAPVAMDDDAETAEDTAVYIDILGNDEDPDGSSLTVELGEPSNGSVSFDGEGYLYTPDADFNGDDSFTYTISDGQLEDTATVNIFVEAINDVPVLAAVEAVSVSEDDAAISVDVLDGATDADGDELTVSAVSASWAGGALTVTQTQTGFSFDPSQLGAELDDGETGVVTVDYSVTDGTASVMASATINVAGADEADVPVIDDPIDETPEDEEPVEDVLIAVNGTADSELLRGTDADEMITSDAGRYDRLFGGGGADDFVFGSETSNGIRERDVIYDFDTADDTICLAAEDYDLRVLGTTGLISVGEDVIYVRGTGITLDALEASIETGCLFEVA